uniref:Uncharacterized protein n=1 Tax=viral metagenome TaxID=1070528 RepID=A0A6M3KD87_9ZZZZ
MRARFSDAGLGLQIVLNCENDDERLLLREFIKNNDKDDMEFCIHGFGSGIDQAGWQHMNFGFREKKQCEVKKV